MENRRIASLDVAKAIGIILVVIGHAITNQANVNQINHPVLLGMINQFHMPLFIAISGYLYSPKYIDHPVRGCVDKIKKYYVPFLKYNLTYLLLHNVFAALHLVDELNGNGRYTLKEYATHFVKAVMGFREYFSGALWFLRTLMIILVLFILADYVIDRLLNKKNRLLFLGIMSIMAYVIVLMDIIPDIMSLPATLTYMLTFYLGHLYKCFNLNTKLLRWKYPLIVIGFIVTFGVAVTNNYGIGKLPFYISLPVSLLGIIMTVMFAQIPVVTSSRLLNLLGKYTLEIMATHFLCFKLVSLIYIKTYGLSIERLADYPVIIGSGGCWWIAYTICGLMVPVVVAVLVKRIKVYLKSRCKQEI